MDPTQIKSYGRRAVARERLGRLDDAMGDIEMAIKNGVVTQELSDLHDKLAQQRNAKLASKFKDLTVDK